MNVVFRTSQSTLTVSFLANGIRRTYTAALNAPVSQPINSSNATIAYTDIAEISSTSQPFAMAVNGQEGLIQLGNGVVISGRLDAAVPGTMASGTGTWSP